MQAQAGCHHGAVMESAVTDAAVLARMRAAVAELKQAGLDEAGMVEAGLDLDTDGDRDCHLRRAVHWQRFSAGPVPELHRACATDLARGFLRLWSAAGGVARPMGRPPARVQMAAVVRGRVAVLRTELAAEAAGLSLRGAGGFEDRVRREVLRVCREIDVALPVEDLLPPRRRPRLENQVTVLLGAAFGAGVSLTAGRLVAAVCPGWMPAAAVGCGLLGLLLTTWTVAVRCLLAERNAAERWLADTLAAVRPALEERVFARIW